MPGSLERDLLGRTPPLRGPVHHQVGSLFRPVVPDVGVQQCILGFVGGQYAKEYNDGSKAMFQFSISLNTGRLGQRYLGLGDNLLCLVFNPIAPILLTLP